MCVYKTLRTLPLLNLPLFQAIGELEKVLEVGRMHVNVLYTFRSVSRAIPMVSGSGDPNKDALHMNTFKVSKKRGQGGLQLQGLRLTGVGRGREALLRGGIV